MARAKKSATSAPPPEDAPPPADSGLGDLFADTALAEVVELGAPLLGFDLGVLTVPQLYALYQDVGNRLPPRTLSSVDLVEELLLQYQIAKALMASVLSNAAVPANQKAQVLNSCAAVLEQVTRTQTALYNAEMIKLIEQAQEKAFMNAPVHVKEVFFARYEQILRESLDRRREKKSQ